MAFSNLKNGVRKKAAYTAETSHWWKGLRYGELALITPDWFPRYNPDHPLAGGTAMSVELFRYRGAARDGGTLEYVFEGGWTKFFNAVTKKAVAEVAADFNHAACRTKLRRVNLGRGFCAWENFSWL
jgi:hypothetical protein